LLSPAVNLKSAYNRKIVIKKVVIGLPPGVDDHMNGHKAYVNNDLFDRWFREVLVSQKAPGTSVLILDVRASHCSSP
jgi:hypothetical protein